MIQYLTQDVLPFWLEHGIDHTNGGIYTCVDEKGQLYGREKSVWFQGRALYIFSYAYNCGLKDPKYLDAAKCIFDFLPKCTDETGRMYFSVTETGEPIQKRRYYFSETFAAIGCCEYALAIGDKNAEALAHKYFDKAYSIYCDPSLTQPKFNPDTYNLDGLSPSMIMLATCQVLRQLDQQKYHTIATKMLERISLHMTPYGLLENVAPDGSFVDTPAGRLLNPGHSLEAAWFIMAEADYRKDAKLMEFGKEIVDISMEHGYRNGGIIAFCDCLGKPATALEWDMQLWWPQCEAMIATKYCANVFGDEKYQRWYDQLKEYVFTHFADKENGEWYGYLHYDGTVSNRLKGNLFKGPFHIPRMMLLVDKLEKKEPLLN